MERMRLNKKGAWIIQRNREVYDMPYEARSEILERLFLELIKRVDVVCPEAFTSANNASVGHLEDLIKKGILFGRKADTIKLGVPNECYDNCMKFTNNRHKIYMGYALISNKKAAILRGVPVTELPEEDEFGWLPHCWLVDKKAEEIIETTSEPFFAYFGMPVNSQYIYGWLESITRYPLIEGDGGMNGCIKNSEILSKMA